MKSTLIHKTLLAVSTDVTGTGELFTLVGILNASG